MTLNTADPLLNKPPDIGRTAPPKPPEPEVAIRITPRLVAVAIAFLFMQRMWIASLRSLTPDEALYWVWSRHLALGYLDHPPMIAYLIRLSTWLLGSTNLGVRLPGVLLSFATALLSMWIAYRLTRQRRAFYLAGLILLLNPLLTVMGTVFTPDTPTCFFSMAALACLILTSSGEQQIPVWSWCLFGVFTGAAMLSKYTAAVPAVATLLALLTSASGRAEFRRPWPYIAALIALIVFAPVVYWNATHDWASFRFQIEHGTSASEGANPAGPLLFLGGQAGVFSPVLFVMGITAIVIYLRHFLKLSRAQNLLLWNATLCLLVFGLASIRARGEVNWADFAYFPLTVLIVELVSRQWSGAWLRWVKIGCTIAILEAIGLQVPELWWKLQVPLPNKMEDIFGWDNLTEKIGEIRGDLPTIANHYQEAAEITFYDQHRSEVWATGIGSRPTAYDYFPNPPDFSKIPRLAYVGGHADLFAEQYGYDIEKVEDANTTLPNTRTRTRPVTLMHRHNNE